MKNFNPKNRYDFSVIEQWISPNARVLDLGCGDGMLLNYLSTHKNTTGFGIEKNKDNWLLSLKNGLDVIQMDLESGLAGFEDNSFDKVVGMYVVSVTQNPDLLIKEMKRVCKPNGDIYLVNHFSFDTDNALIKILEKGLMPISKYLGWRPYFPFSEFNAYAKLNVQSISKINLFDYWGIIHAINSPVD